MTLDFSQDSLPEDDGGGASTPVDVTGRIPPDVQARRDAVRLAMLQQERAQEPDDGAAAGALDTEIRSTRTKLPDFSSESEPVGGLDFSALSEPAEAAKPAARAPAVAPVKAVQPAEEESYLTRLGNTLEEPSAPPAPPAPRSVSPVTALIPDTGPGPGAPVRPEVRRAIEGQLATDANDGLMQDHGWRGQVARQIAPENAARVKMLYDEALRKGATPEAAQAWAERNAVTADQATASKTDFDFDTAKRYEDTTVGIRAAVKTLATAKQQAGGVIQAFGDIVGADTEGVRAVNKNYQRVLDAMGEGRRGASYLEQQFEGALVSLGTQGPQMLYATLGAPAAAAMSLGAMFMQQAGQEYTQGRDKGLDQQDALARATFYGTAEVVGEVIGLPAARAFARSMLEAGVPTKSLMHAFAEYLIKEQGGEQVTTALEFGFDKFAREGLNKDATLEDYLNQVRDTAVQTTMQTLLTGAAGKVAHHLSGNAAAQKQAEQAAQVADDARTAALSKWADLETALKGSPRTANPTAPSLRTPAVEPAPLAPIDFQPPPPPEPGANLSLVPKDAQGAPAAGIPFTQPDPLAPAKGIEDLIAQREADAAKRAEGVDFQPTPLPGAPLDLAKRAKPAYGNEIEIQPFLQELALLKANNVPVGDWLGQGDLIGRPFHNETLDLLSQVGALADTNPAAAADAVRMIEDFKPTKEERNANAPAAPSAPAPDTQIARTGQETGLQPEPASAIASAPPAEVAAPGASNTTDIDLAAHAAATSPHNDLPEPTQAQKEAGNYPKGHAKIAGLDISIENPAGSKRRPEWPALKSHYGYIRRSEGADGDHVDTFVKQGTPPDWQGPVFVVDQLNAKGNKFDEHKVVLGAASMEEAKRLYAENYTKGWKVGPVTQMTLPQFKAWLASPFTKRPVKSLSLSEWDKIKPVVERTPADIERLQQVEGEIGWGERGGQLLRAPDTGKEKPEVIGRMPWVAKSDFWPGRPNGITETIAKEALRKFVAGEPLGTAEKRFIDYADQWLGEHEREALKLPEKPARVEQRRDDARRKAVAQMTPEEKDRALLTDELTGIPNLRAYNEAIAAGDAASHAHADMDGVKYVNDFMGHEAGDEIVKAMATALHQEAVERGARAFRTGGDEFKVLAKSEDQALEVMNAATERLNGATLTATMKDGTTATLKGVGFSYGIGSNPKDAEGSLQWHKDERAFTGARAGRGEPPPQLARVAAEQTSVARREPAAEEQHVVASEPSEPVPAKEPSSETTETLAPAGVSASGSLQDFGEKIGGARKDLWRERGLDTEDLEAMSGGEQAQYATKDNVWPKIDYAKMVAAGTEPAAAAHLKLLRDRMAAKPRHDTAQGRRDYVETVAIVRDLAAKVKNTMDVSNIGVQVHEALGLPAKMGYGDRYSPENKPKLEKLFSVYKARSSPFARSYGDERRVREMLAEGWPGAKARSAEGSTKSDGPAMPERPYLDNLQRTGEDVRVGRNITSREFTETFGFRGVEFGNWAASDERQRILNMAFEALHDLAGVIGVPPKAISLNGTLGLALAARGGGKAAAHYEPGKLVINMTKLRGAGSLAHEWGHALDHYLGELEQPNAYQGRARGASGWYSRRDYRDDKGALKNLRPELGQAFDGLMRALFHKSSTKAEMVRDAELAIERVQARLEQATDASTKAYLERTLASQKQSLAEMREKMAEGERVFNGGNSSYATEANRLSGKSGASGYWSRPTEMFARAFESYVFDRTRADDRMSDYLVHGVEEERYAVGYKGNPYPTGAERRVIGEAFDKLFEAIETKDTDRGLAMYKQGEAGEGMDAGDVREALKPLIERSRVPIRVVQTVEELRELDGYDDAPADAQGGYFDGRIVLVADNIADPLQAERIAAQHEITHAGIDVVYGGAAAREEALRNIVSKNPKVARAASAWRISSSKRALERYRKRGMSEAAAAKAVLLDSFEEGIASFAQEEGNTLNGWRAFVATIQRALRTLGFNRLADSIERATSAETMALLDQLRRATEQRDESGAGLLQPAFARSGTEDLARLDRAMRRVDEMVTMWEKGTLTDAITASLGETPRAMQIAGAPAKPLYLTGAVVAKAFSPAKHGHQLTPATLREIPGQLLEPTLIFRSETDGGRGALVVVTELVDRTGNPVIVPIHVNVQEGRIEANRVASVYGREDGVRVLEAWAKKGLLLYADKSKTASAPATTSQLSPGKADPGRFFQVVQQGEAANPNLRSDSDVVKRWGAMFARTSHSEPIDFPGHTPAAASTASAATNRPSGGTNPPSGATNAPVGGTPPPNRGTPGATTLGNTNGWTGPAASKMDNVIYTLQDKHVDTKRVVKAIEASGAAVTDAEDPYLQEELFHGRAAKGVEDFLGGELKPLLKDMATRGVKIEAFEEWLHARHAEERNQQIARINPALPDGGSGMTTADARAVLARVRQAGMEPAMRALATSVDAITNRTRQMLVGYGLEEAAAVATWAQAYQHYVPLQREDMESGPGIGQGFSVRGAQKRATGSTRAVVNILANVALQRERAIVRGEKNRVANALVGLATSNPNPAFWRVDIPPTIKSVDPHTGMVTTHVDPLYKSRPNVIVARTPDANGNVVEHAVVFNEHDERAERMAMAMKNLDIDQLGVALGTVAKATRFMAAMSTQYNPIFGIVNLTRDTQDAMLNLTSTAIAGKQAEVAKHILPALRGVYIDLRAQRHGAATTSSWAQLWEEFQREGGKTGYRDMFRTSDERAEALHRELARAAGKGGLTMKAMQPIANWLSDYNEAMENATRLAAYKVAIDHGLTKQRAASLAKNLTVNFNRRGAATAQVAALYAFFNASVQGSARTLETLAGPAGLKIIAGGVTLGVLQAVALAMAGFDDDEPPEFVREKNLIIPIGGKRYVTIPMPLGFLVLPNLGRVSTEFVLGHFKNPAKRVADLLGVVIDAFSPLGNVASFNAKSAAQVLAPTVADPIVSLATNQDWTGKPIYREDLNKLHPTPGHTRNKDTSTIFAQVTAKAINAMTGGTAYKPGVYSPTADEIDFLVGQVTGGVGREVSKLSQTVTGMASGEEVPPYKIPLLGRFYGNAESGSAQASKFYDNLKDLAEHGAELRGRKRAGESASEYIRENPEARLVPMAEGAERRVSQLRRRKHDLLQKDAPREQVRAIEERIDAEMKHFNDRMREARAQ